jgi:hypothetical protein
MADPKSRAGVKLRLIKRRSKTRSVGEEVPLESRFQVQGPSNEFRYQDEMYLCQSRCYTEKPVLDVRNRLATAGELDIPVRG